MVTTGRPAWRAYLLLSRVSNLPTVWTNVLGAVVVAGAPVATAGVARLAVAVSLLYTAGMFLNDAFDRDFDAVHRSDRPIPAGDVRARSAFLIGFALMAAGVLLVALQPRPTPALWWALVLAGAIVFYDYRHKQNPFGSLVMGLCRGLVYVVVASAVAPGLLAGILAAAAVQTGYVQVLTIVARRLGQRASVVVPLMVAGISLVDAGIILAAGGGPLLAGAAVAAFGLTLLFQRYVPGT